MCCTCRTKVQHGAVLIDENFAFEPRASDKGFVLSCQPLRTTDRVEVSDDER